MSEFTIEVQGGATVRLPTGGKYCPQDILITGKGGDTEAAYNEGYEAGAKEGAEVGYAKGEAEGYNKGYADGFICDFSKMRYAYFHDLNGFTKSDVVLNLGNHGVDEWLFFRYMPYQANNTLERLTVNIAEAIQNLSWEGTCNSAKDNKLKHLTINAPNAKFKSGYGIFQHWQALEVIDGTPIDLSLDTKGASCEFIGCFALREVRFAPNTLRGNMWFGNSQYLSEASVQSIIDGLMDLTGQTAKTLTFHSTTKAKLTDEQIRSIILKNWTV